jgi:hypothetical protein
MNAERREVFVSALAASLAAAPLAHAFGHGELERWWQERPLSLFVLFAAGMFLSVLGATVVRYLRVPKFRHSSKVGELVHGGLVGAIFGLAAGGVGWIMAETSLWALLLWFVVGAGLLCVARSSFTKRMHSAG